LDDKRKPEWAPQDSGAEFASRIVAGKENSSGSVSQAAKAHRQRRFDLNTLVEGVRSSNRTLLSKAITLIESNAHSHFSPGQELLKQLLPMSGKSIRIGITGVPGAGKSTFIESFGQFLIQQGHKVAVLAIDPSSTISKGSILGDKTRMEKLSRQENSFIRPSPSAGVLGGVARKTRETMILCEAAGYDVILVETVGVGQSEITVRSMVDFFLVMQIAGAGDELQGIKKGIIELADLIVINKADGDNVQRTELAAREYNNALHYLRPSNKAWHAKAITCSALLGTGIVDIWNLILEYRQATNQSGEFVAQRSQQNIQWFESLISEQVLSSFYHQNTIKTLLPHLKQQVAKGDIPVALAVAQLIQKASLNQE